MFQHTAARRRLASRQKRRTGHSLVSTHSRPKAAGKDQIPKPCMWQVSTHSRPKAAGSLNQQTILFYKVSTHSRPKAAGDNAISSGAAIIVSTHSRPKAAGAAIVRPLILPKFQHTAARRRLDNELGMPIPKSQFQHTAARRRLGPIDEALLDSLLVSTHSRPKAAGVDGQPFDLSAAVSTHSRPKAAGKVQRHFIACAQFQHTAARRRLAGLQEVGHD